MYSNNSLTRKRSTTEKSPGWSLKKCRKKDIKGGGRSLSKTHDVKEKKKEIAEKKEVPATEGGRMTRVICKPLRNKRTNAHHTLEVMTNCLEGGQTSKREND